MNNKYICLCKSVFSTEEDFLDHCKKVHMTVVKDSETEDGGLDYLLDKVKNEFPTWDVDIENGQGWYAYARYIIHLRNDKTVIEQYFGNDNNNFTGNPEKINDLITQIKWKIETANEIVELAKNIGEFEDFHFDNFDHGYSDDEHRFTFAFKLKGDSEYRYESYRPWDNKWNDKSEFINDFKKYFITKLEGKVVSVYEDGYFDTFSIDGVSIDTILNEAIRKGKNVRLEIL